MKVNVYDFDGTIYDGDSARDFVKYCYKKGYITLKEYFHVYYTYFKYLVGVYDKTEFKQIIYKFLTFSYPPLFLPKYLPVFLSTLDAINHFTLNSLQIPSNKK